MPNIFERLENGTISSKQLSVIVSDLRANKQSMRLSAVFLDEGEELRFDDPDNALSVLGSSNWRWHIIVRAERPDNPSRQLGDASLSVLLKRIINLSNDVNAFFLVTPSKFSRSEKVMEDLLERDYPGCVSSCWEGERGICSGLGRVRLETLELDKTGTEVLGMPKYDECDVAAATIMHILAGASSIYPERFLYMENPMAYLLSSNYLRDYAEGFNGISPQEERYPIEEAQKIFSEADWENVPSLCRILPALDVYPTAAKFARIELKRRRRHSVWSIICSAFGYSAFSGSSVKVTPPKSLKTAIDNLGFEGALEDLFEDHTVSPTSWGLVFASVADGMSWEEAKEEQRSSVPSKRNSLGMSFDMSYSIVSPWNALSNALSSALPLSETITRTYRKRTLLPNSNTSRRQCFIIVDDSPDKVKQNEQDQVSLMACMALLGYIVEGDTISLLSRDSVDGKLASLLARLVAGESIHVLFDPSGRVGSPVGKELSEGLVRTPDGEWMLPAVLPDGWTLADVDEEQIRNLFASHGFISASFEARPILATTRDMFFGKAAYDALSCGFSRLDVFDGDDVEVSLSGMILDDFCLRPLLGLEDDEMMKWYDLGREMYGLCVIWEEIVGWAPILPAGKGKALVDEIGRVAGVESFIEAYCAGVPVEDLLAHVSLDAPF